MTVAILDAQVEVQFALNALLSADSYFIDNNIKVFDQVPKGTQTPYVTIGDMTVVDNSTQGIGGQVITLMIHTWDQDLSSRLTKTIMARIITLLHDKQLTLDTGYTNTNTRFVNSQTIKDPDGLTLHGVQKFRIVVENQ